jgi:aromatic ring-opening dioxygenase LigB subunit
MPLVFGAIAPHGFPIIPNLSDDAEGALATRSAMEELGRRCAAAHPDVIVIAGPHGVRVNDAICVADVARGAGTLHWAGRTVDMNVPVDGEMTDIIVAEARADGIPIALAGYAGNRRSQSVLPLDWGLITPLWFLGHDRNLPGSGDVLFDPPEIDTGPPVVIVSPSRSVTRQQLVDFGRAVGRAAANSDRNVALVASCDWAHRHREDGPYGFHSAAEIVDRQVVAAVNDGDLGRLMDLDDAAAEDAAIDGLWQALMLAGALEVTPLTHDLLSYEAPSYYGMIVASYAPSAA